MKNMRTVLVVKAKDKSEAKAALEYAMEALDADDLQKDIEIKVSVPTKRTYNLVSMWKHGLYIFTSQDIRIL